MDKFLYIIFFILAISAASPYSEAQDKPSTTEEHELRHEHSVSPGEPFSGAEQVFTLGKEHGIFLRKKLIKLYCKYFECEVEEKND